MLVEIKYCSPKCHLFKCGQQVVICLGNRIWCKWTDEECSVAKCSYSTCVRRQLLPGGVCSESVKRRTVELRPEEDTVLPVKLKGKALRKLRDREIY